MMPRPPDPITYAQASDKLRDKKYHQLGEQRMDQSLQGLCNPIREARYPMRLKPIKDVRSTPNGRLMMHDQYTHFVPGKNNIRHQYSWSPVS